MPAAYATWMTSIVRCGGDGFHPVSSWMNPPLCRAFAFRPRSTTGSCRQFSFSPASACAGSVLSGSSPPAC